MVAVIGDASTDPAGAKAVAARQVGALIIERRWRLVTGGMGGVMKEASAGARASVAWVDGDIIGIAPGSDPAAANPFVDVVIATGMDHLRNSIVANSDAIIVIGGTGNGRNDNSVQTLAREGWLAVHGIAMTPGETAALGFAAQRPVLMLPGRLDAALAVWLLVGRRILERLAAATHQKDADPLETLPLARKVTSTVGLNEVVPVRRVGGTVEPLAVRYLPLSALTHSDGWILVPADSEGYSEGTDVAIRPWP